MAFWKKKSEPDEDVGQRSAERSSSTDLNQVWREASTAMQFYLNFRTEYNMLPSPGMWRDDYALGFRDSIGHIHFSLLNAEIPRAEEALPAWKLMVVGDDAELNNHWRSVIASEGDYTARGKDGIQGALILESWRLQLELSPGVFTYIARHEADYRERFPDATQFNMDQWLLMNLFVLPLMMDDKKVHPLLLAV